MIEDMRTFAHDLLRLCDKVEDQADEIAHLREYRKKYAELLNETTQHNGEMMCNLLKLTMTPGVLAACAAANPPEKP